MNDDRANDTCAEATIDDAWRTAPDSLAGGSAAQRAYSCESERYVFGFDLAGPNGDHSATVTVRVERDGSFTIDNVESPAPDSLAGGDAEQRAMDPAAASRRGRDPSAEFYRSFPKQFADHDYVPDREESGECAACGHGIGKHPAPSPSQPSPVPASPKDDVASPSAAQTVAQAAGVYAGERAGALAESHAPPEVWHAIGSAAYHGHLAGAAWMREQLQSPESVDAAAEGIYGARTKHGLGGMTEAQACLLMARAAIAALCASDAEKEKPG